VRLIARLASRFAVRVRLPEASRFRRHRGPLVALVASSRTGWGLARARLLARVLWLGVGVG
jgi:hypothetical protein